MVRPLSALLALAFAVFLSTPLRAEAPPPTLDQIIARHIQARGGEAALRALVSVKWSDGQYSENGVAEGGGHASMIRMRPYFKLVGDPTANPDIMEGYDGSAWEWYRDPGVTLRTVGAANAASRHFLDVEGPFLDWKAKGEKLELVGKADIGGRPCWQVRLTMMDGFTVEEFFDAKTWLNIAERQSAPIHAFGASVTVESRFDDWRPVAGVLFNFNDRAVEIATGKELSAMHWGKIEANQPIPREWFSPPVYQPTPLQDLMQHLYDERDDASAMLWTWSVFRRAHPDLDVSTAAQVAGYQALKMGDVAPAIALLERASADYPDSADTAFGLGRAYATAGRNDDARREYERALKLDPKHPRAARALAGLDAAKPTSK